MDSERTFFITTVTWKRLPIFRNRARARLLLDVMLDYRDQGRYSLHEFVIMPDHIHALLTPSPSISLKSGRFNSLKAVFHIGLGNWKRWKCGRQALRITESGTRRIASGTGTIYV
jgi:REP element-mobilizing transposase RayT